MSEHSNHGHRERLRERFLRTGFGGFSEHEVVELILTLCIPRGDVKPRAKALLTRYGNLRAIFDAPLHELSEIKGIGKVTPVALRIIRDTANLYLQQSLEAEEALNSTEKIEAFCKSRLSGLKHEVFEVLYLDKRFRMIQDGIERVEEGTVDAAPVIPRKLMEHALRKAASGIILIHNHPGGTPKPSPQDIQLTHAVIEAGRSLGVKVIDHLIVAGDYVYSFKRNKLIK